MFAKAIRSYKYFCFILNCTRDYNTNRFAALCALATGELVYLPKTTHMRFLRIMFGADTLWDLQHFGIKHRYEQYRMCECAMLLDDRTRVCYFTNDNTTKIKFCKSAGCVSILLKNYFNVDTGKSAILLPSKQVKLVNSDNILLIGGVVGKRKKFFKNTRAGHNRTLGFKQTVRGVVKNPVDHPHGGRTRTILWPRSP